MLIYFITKRQKAQSKVYPVENAVEVKDYAKENRFLTLKYRKWDLLGRTPQKKGKLTRTLSIY